MLDFGIRSGCCRAPVRLGKSKKNNILKQVWVCTKCRKSNISIISLKDIENQVNRKNLFSEEI